MDTLVSEIRIEGTQPWTPRQEAGARAAIRAYLETYSPPPASESKVEETLKFALDFAARYCPDCRGASLCCEYYSGVHGTSAEFDALAAKMQAACEGMDITVTVGHYR